VSEGNKAVISVEKCPTCKLKIVTRSRMLNRAMGEFLIALYRYHRDGSWAHVPTLARRARVTGIIQSREYMRLIYWGMIERRPGEKDDGNPHAGYYCITDRGRRFVEGKIRVISRIIMRNHQFVGFDRRPGCASKVTISEVLDKPFNYRRDVDGIEGE